MKRILAPKHDRNIFFTIYFRQYCTDRVILTVEETMCNHSIIKQIRFRFIKLIFEHIIILVSISLIKGYLLNNNLLAKYKSFKLNSCILLLILLPVIFSALLGFALFL